MRRRRLSRGLIIWLSRWCGGFREANKAVKGESAHRAPARARGVRPDSELTNPNAGAIERSERAWRNGGTANRFAIERVAGLRGRSPPRSKQYEDFQPRARQLTPSAVGRSHGRRRLSSAVQTARRRQTDPLSSRPSRAPVPGHRPGRAVVRRAVVGRVRDGRHPARPDPRRARRVQYRDADRLRHRGDPGHRRLLVPADDPRLSERRRRLHRRARTTSARRRR